MSHELFSHSLDLARLRDEGYAVEIRGGFLVLYDVPYVNAQRQVRRGTLISSLTLAGNQTSRPDTHVVHFDGEYPCGSDGNEISALRHQSAATDLGHGLRAMHSFSNKPQEGYVDYHDKMTRYATILSAPAQALDPSSSPRPHRLPDPEAQSVFHYLETASGRASIGALTERFEPETVAIVGLGGSGSYVLDLVAKTPVREIRCFEDDDFLQHNAFRAPGAPSLDELRGRPKKADYLHRIYSRMHRNICMAPALNASNVSLLGGITFAFLCMPPGADKRAVVDELERLNVSFLDLGMGLELTDGSLGGMLRQTLSTPTCRSEARTQIPLERDSADDLYASNIQVADLNAANAAFAVIRWKRVIGFYRDAEGEFSSLYVIDGNQMANLGKR